MFTKRTIFIRMKRGLEIKRFLRNDAKNLKLSYIFQPGDIRLTSATIGELVNRAADNAGDSTAFISYHQNIRKTFSEFQNDVHKLASGLLSLGLVKGDRVALCAPNMYEWPIVQHATAKAGIVLVNVNPAYQVDELEYCLKKVGCRAFITSDVLKTQNFYDMLRSIVPELETSKPGYLKSKRLPNLQSVILLTEKPESGTFTFGDIMEAGDSKSDKLLSEAEKRVQFDDAINIQFTSGTTGSPKAAVLTHHNVINNALLTSTRLNYYVQKPIVCCQVPLYHCFGNVLGTIGSVLNQHTCVFPSKIFNVEESMKAIEDLKCTAMYGTPTMFVDLVDKYKAEVNDVSSIKQAVIGGASCPENVLRELHERLGIPHLHLAYGLTETSPAVTVNPIAKDLETVFARYIPPLEHIEFKVSDKDGRVLPVGTHGELCVRGHVVFAGYWEQKEKTDEVIDKHGWFHTGDLVSMNEEGNIRIIGRQKDMVIRGGENLYPQEIENFLHKHSAILEAHICGVPDRRMGEELCAWIKLREGENLTEEEIKNYCKGKISHFKIPCYIMLVNEFPKTVSGKIQKFKMRQISIKKLSL